MYFLVIFCEMLFTIRVVSDNFLVSSLFQDIHFNLGIFGRASCLVALCKSAKFCSVAENFYKPRSTRVFVTHDFPIVTLQEQLLLIYVV